MASIKKTLRAARVLHIALFVMVAIDFDVSYRLAPIQKQIPPILVYAITFVGLNEIGVAAFLRNRMIKPSEELGRTSAGWRFREKA